MIDEVGENGQLKFMTGAEFRYCYPDILKTVFAEGQHDSSDFRDLATPYFADSSFRTLLFPSEIGGLDLRHLADWKSFAEMGRTCPPVNLLNSIMLGHWCGSGGDLFVGRLMAFEGRGPFGKNDDIVVKTKATAQNLDEALYRTIGTGGIHVVFAESGEWGMLSTFWDENGALGAKGDLFDTFVGCLGGIGRIRDTMIESIVEQALNKDGILDSQGRNVIDAYQPAFEAAGWDWPFEPHFDPEKYL